MKKFLSIVPSVLLFCFTIACQDKAAMAELEKYKAQAKLEEQNKGLYRKAIEEWNRRNYGYFKDVYGPGYAFFLPSGTSNSMSREEVIEMIKTVWTAFPDSVWNINEIVAGGDMVMTRNTIKGTHLGMFQNIPATGNKVEFSVMNICHMKDGKIIEEREDVDMLSLFRQLGMELKPMPTPSEPAKTTEAMLSALRDTPRAWFEGLLAKDTKILNKVLSEEVTLGFPGGNAMPRAEFLSLLQSGELFYDTAEHESVGFRIYGNTAVATGRSNLTYRYKGAKDFERLSYTAVYVRTNGGWKMVAWQSTRRPN